MNLKTPYYLIDESRLIKNLEKIQYLEQRYAIKSVLALKCFSTWSVFPLMQQYLAGTTSSSLYEVKLGREKFAGEVHAYSVAFSADEIQALPALADKIIFNSLSQFHLFYDDVASQQIGLRINPEVSHSDYPLANPTRKYSRLGVKDYDAVMEIADKLDGIMMHFNCENEDFDSYSRMINYISDKYATLLHQLDWISLGGGVSFTYDKYPLEKFGQLLQQFSQRFSIQIYLEPGETTVVDSTTLVTTVLDIVENEVSNVIVDSTLEAHMLDLLVFRKEAKINGARSISPEHPALHRYMITGKSCLAGDIFGMFEFDKPLCIGDEIHVSNAASYTIVKKNWFNGISMPSIVVKRLNGKKELIKSFNYNDFRSSHS
jgi:carboxynorspermidine decarboxylase